MICIPSDIFVCNLYVNSLYAYCMPLHVTLTLFSTTQVSISHLLWNILVSYFVKISTFSPFRNRFFSANFSVDPSPSGESVHRQWFTRPRSRLSVCVTDAVSLESRRFAVLCRQSVHRRTITQLEYRPRCVRHREQFAIFSRA